jgi:hypothetical protein
MSFLGWAGRDCYFSYGWLLWYFLKAILKRSYQNVDMSIFGMSLYQAAIRRFSQKYTGYDIASQYMFMVFLMLYDPI